MHPLDDVTQDLAHGCLLWRGWPEANQSKPSVRDGGQRQSIWRVAWLRAGMAIQHGYSLVPCEHSRLCVNVEHLSCLPHPEAVATGNRRAWKRRKARAAA